MYLPRPSLGLKQSLTKNLDSWHLVESNSEDFLRLFARKRIPLSHKRVVDIGRPKRLFAPFQNAHNRRRQGPFLLVAGDRRWSRNFLGRRDPPCRGCFWTTLRLQGDLLSLQQVIDLLLKGFNFFRDRGGTRKLFGC